MLFTDLPSVDFILDTHEQTYERKIPMDENEIFTYQEEQSIKQSWMHNNLVSVFGRLPHEPVRRQDFYFE